MVVRPSSGASNVAAANNGQIDFDIVLNEPFKYIQEYIKKKIRNLEKRKGKLDGYKEKLKKGETLTKDQQEAVNKFGEVTGMLTFANELVSHITGVDSSAKKERKKRARRDQLKADSDRVELVTRALEMFTLMHLTEPDDKIVTPLRERTSFHPSPGAHLNEFAAGTAKLLISLCDEEKEQTELFISDEEGHVKYQQVKEKLELIRPKYNPVPEYTDDASDYAPEAEEPEPSSEPKDEEEEDVKAELEGDLDVEVVSDGGFENGIETETSSPVEINGIEEQNGSEDGFVSIQHVEPTAATDPTTTDPAVTSTDPSALEATAQDEVIELAKSDDIEAIEEVDYEEAVEDNLSEEMVQIPTTMEFVNREVYGEEDKIKEILVEVSSGFNFLAPPDEPDFDQETEFKNDLGLRFTSEAHPGVDMEQQQQPGGPHEVDSIPIPQETVSFENSNFDPSKDMKDEPTWQQRQQGPQRQVYRNTGHTNTSYRNSQRYQRNFENRRPANGTAVPPGEPLNRNINPNRNGKSVRGQNGGTASGESGGGYKRTNNYDSRRSAKS